MCLFAWLGWRMYCVNTKQRLIGESIGYYTSKPLVHKSCDSMCSNSTVGSNIRVLKPLAFIIVKKSSYIRSKKLLRTFLKQDCTLNSTLYFLVGSRKNGKLREQTVQQQGLFCCIKPKCFPSRAPFSLQPFGMPSRTPITILLEGRKAAGPEENQHPWERFFGQ